MAGNFNIIEHFPYLGLFGLLLLGGIGLPFPEDTTLILCGFLISIHVIKPLHALLVVYAGLLIADFSLYSIGKKYGRRIVAHNKFRNIISPERLASLEDKFARKGILIILLGRHLAGFSAQIFLVAGVMRMSTAKFLITDAVSSVFTIMIMVGVGYLGGNSLKVIKKDVTQIDHILILSGVFLLVIYLLFKYVSVRKGRT